jgi:hypothetical protein
MRTKITFLFSAGLVVTLLLWAVMSTRDIASTEDIVEDGVQCDDSIKQLNNVRLHQLIRSNTINIVRLEELIGTSVDNGLTSLRIQIRVFIGQIDCAKSELRARGVNL